MPTQQTEAATTAPGSTSTEDPRSSANPSPSPGVTAPGLTVRQPTPSPTTASSEGPSSAGAGDVAPDPLDRTGTRSASEPAATGAVKVGRRELREVFRGLVLGASVAVHQALARTELEREHKVWLMESEAEAAGVADPLAALAGRRAGAAEVSTDAADLIAAGIAVAGYVLSNVMKSLQLRRAARAMREHVPGFIPNPEGQES